MNTTKTKQYLDANGIVPMKADMTRKSPAIEQLLDDLGHKTKAIPYIAIFPGDGSPPVTYAGILTQSKILDLLASAEQDLEKNDAEKEAGQSSETVAAQN